MFDGNVPEAYTTQIAHEMRLIGELGYAPYFLTVYAIVREARRRGILCQDHRNLQLSLRAHPLSFVRDELTRRGVTRCADLASVRDGRHVEVPGIILVRQKPGSAKGVLFITIEDETGIANGILWPDRFEAQRRTVMSASMVGIKGRVQKEVVQRPQPSRQPHPACARSRGSEQQAARSLPVVRKGAPWLDVRSLQRPDQARCPRHPGRRVVGVAGRQRLRRRQRAGVRGYFRPERVLPRR
jgi:DNA polymerase III alpha subunit